MNEASHKSGKQLRDQFANGIGLGTSEPVVECGNRTQLEQMVLQQRSSIGVGLEVVDPA